MAGEKKETEYSALTFWLLFIAGLVVVVGLYKACMGPVTLDRSYTLAETEKRKAPKPKVKGHHKRPRIKVKEASAHDIVDSSRYYLSVCFNNCLYMHLVLMLKAG